jgi:hypothetical protein
LSAAAERLVASLRELQVAARAADEASATATASTSGRAARTSSSGSGGSGGGGPPAADDLENADPQAIAALRDMCSGVASAEFLAHILVRACSGDVEVRAPASRVTCVCCKADAPWE